MSNDSRIYTSEEIRVMCDDTVREGIETFYRKKRGKKNVTTHISSSNDVAKYLLERPDLWERITPITRKRTYNRKRDVKPTDVKEARLAMSMFASSNKKNHGYKALGKVITHQIPIRGARKDPKVGCIDLMSLSNNKDALYLVELKTYVSEESLLHCVLQIYTYFRLIDQEKLKKDFKIPSDTDSDTKVNIVPVVAIFKGSLAHTHLDGRFPKVLELIRELKVKIALLSGDVGEHMDGSKIQVEWWLP